MASWSLVDVLSSVRLTCTYHTLVTITLGLVGTQSSLILALPHFQFTFQKFHFAKTLRHAALWDLNLNQRVNLRCWCSCPVMLPVSLVVLFFDRSYCKVQRPNGSSPSAQPNVSNDQVSPRFVNENKQVSSTTRKPTKIAKQSRTSIPSFKVCFHNHFRELLANRKSRVGAPFCRCFAKLLLQHTCNNQIECRERCCARHIAYKASRWARSKTLCKSRLTMHTGTASKWFV